MNWIGGRVERKEERRDERGGREGGGEVKKEKKEIDGGISLKIRW
jgi:hypothetical protein